VSEGFGDSSGKRKGFSQKRNVHNHCLFDHEALFPKGYVSENFLGMSRTMSILSSQTSSLKASFGRKPTAHRSAMPSIAMEFVTVPGIFPNVPEDAPKTLYKGTYDLPPEGKCADAVFEDIRQKHALGNLTWLWCTHLQIPLEGEAMWMTSIKKVKGGHLHHQPGATEQLFYIVESTADFKMALKKYDVSIHDHIDRKFNAVKMEYIRRFNQFVQSYSKYDLGPLM
jgi:hypothetical protein